MSHLVKILWARAKDLDGKEVFGWAKFYNYMDRKYIYRLYSKKNNKESILVDPLSVEFYTGIDDVMTGEQIFEGDVIRLQEDDMMVNACSKSQEEDALCEICLSYDLVNHNKPFLFVHNVEGVNDLRLSNKFKSVTAKFDKLRWVKVGRVNDEQFGLPYEEHKKRLKRDPSLSSGSLVDLDDPNEMVFPVHNSALKGLEKVRFFGSYARRTGIAESMIFHGFFFFLLDIHPEMIKLKEVWGNAFWDYWDSPNLSLTYC